MAIHGKCLVPICLLPLAYALHFDETRGIVKEVAQETVTNVSLKMPLHLKILGTGRSGTHTLSDAFREASFDTKHEQLAPYKFVPCLHGNIVVPLDRMCPGVQEWIVARERELAASGTEVDAAFFLGSLAAHLENMEPTPRYIFTVRDPWSWLRSMFSLSSVPKSDVRENLQRFFGPPPSATLFPKQEALLVLNNPSWYPLATVMRYWCAYNQEVPDVLPPERTLVLKTHELDYAASKIEGFLALPSGKLGRLGRSSVGANTEFAEFVDNSYLDQIITSACPKVLEKYFPNVHSFAQAACLYEDCGEISADRQRGWEGRANGPQMLQDQDHHKTAHCGLGIFRNLPSTATYEQAFHTFQLKCRTAKYPHPDSFCDKLSEEAFEHVEDIKATFAEEAGSFFCQTLTRLVGAHYVWAQDKGYEATQGENDVLPSLLGSSNRESLSNGVIQRSRDLLSKRRDAIDAEFDRTLMSKMDC